MTFVISFMNLKIIFVSFSLITLNTSSVRLKILMRILLVITVMMFTLLLVIIALTLINASLLVVANLMKLNLPVWSVLLMKIVIVITVSIALITLVMIFSVPSDNFLLHLYRTDDGARWATVSLSSLSEVEYVIYALDMDRFYYDIEVV